MSMLDAFLNTSPMSILGLPCCPKQASWGRGEVGSGGGVSRRGGERDGGGGLEEGPVSRGDMSARAMCFRALFFWSFAFMSSASSFACAASLSDAFPKEWENVFSVDWF